MNIGLYLPELSYDSYRIFRSANAIFGKIGRTASEEVTLELLRSKCIPVLIYGLECFSLPKSEIVGLCCHPFSYEIV